VSRSLSLLLAAAVAAPLFAGSATAAAPCQAGVGIRLLEAPTGTRDPRALTYVIDHVAPGAVLTRRFEVCNGTNASTRLSFYPNAATIRDGHFTITEGRATNELTGWTAVSPSGATLAPNQRVTLTATIRVPKDATGGERYGVVLAELPATPNPQGVAVASRVGVRIYLDVGGPKAPKSDFAVDTLQASRRADGTAIVTAQVHNTGARALDMRGSLTLRDGPDGLSAGPYPATLGTTLGPGQTEPVTVVLGKSITGGPWTARLTLTSGLLERRAEGKLTFPDAAGSVAPPVKAKNIPLAKDRRVLVPLAIGLIGILLALLFFLWLLAKLRSKRREKDEDVDARRAAAAQ
jgi:hypothetical protein